ncbi:MAG: Stp1/IreP family PP2C-type Ser/Thr phosphatase [Deltaproteobacteria bacterium]|nr:Stp1/IreP family PP2C-type Ser/Thr phosphatase [Deltaproteobacteria bacterium]
MPVQVAGETDVGQKRNHNEDTFSINESEALFVVCDGMGGHASGEVASQMAVETIRTFFKDTRDDPEVTWPYKMDRSRQYEENRLTTAIKYANVRIFESAKKEPKFHGMGTTITALYFIEDGVYRAHVGDSRIYRFREGEYEQISEDHSLLNDYIKMKKLTPEEIASFPHKNVIVRALGMKESVKVDVVMEKPKSGDIYLMCSDGLSDEVSDEKMAEILAAHGSDVQSSCHALVEEANRNGGHDNITVVLVRVP